MRNLLVAAWEWATRKPAPPPQLAPPVPTPRRRSCEEAHSGVALPGDQVWYAARMVDDKDKAWRLLGPATVLATYLAGEEKRLTYRLDNVVGNEIEVPGLCVLPTREHALQWLEDRGLKRLEDVIWEATNNVIARMVTKGLDSLETPDVEDSHISPEPS